MVLRAGGRKLHETARASPKTAGPSSDSTDRPNSVSPSFSLPLALLPCLTRDAWRVRAQGPARPNQLFSHLNPSPPPFYSPLVGRHSHNLLRLSLPRRRPPPPPATRHLRDKPPKRERTRSSHPMEEDSLKGMISAICWVPRGAARSVPVVADPPTQEEIAEAMKTFALGREWVPPPPGRALLPAIVTNFFLFYCNLSVSSIARPAVIRAIDLV